LTVRGEFLVKFLPPRAITLETRGNRPLTYRLADDVLLICRQLGVEAGLLGIDCSGTQGSLADIIGETWAPKPDRLPLRVAFGGKASTMPLSARNPAPGNTIYANRVTELWGRVYEYCKYQHVRGLAVSTIREFCSRQLTDKINPMQLETKSDMRRRIGTSPDEADATAVLLTVVRERLGLIPNQRQGTINGAGHPGGVDYQLVPLYDNDPDRPLVSSYAETSAFEGFQR